MAKFNNDRKKEALIQNVLSYRFSVNDIEFMVAEEIETKT